VPAAANQRLDHLPQLILTNRSTQGRFGTASNDHHAHQLDHAPIRRDFQNDVSEVISE
jgi:hypothetical protein